MIMKKIYLALFLNLCLLSALFGGALAQGDTLTLSLSRDFGYSSGTGRIQGRFSMRVEGPENLARVVFMIDGQPVNEDGEAPFRFQFETDDYGLGVHTLSAIGYTAAGLELHSNEYRQEFVAAEEGWQSAGKIALPIFGLAFAVILLSFVLPLLLGRGKRAEMPPGTQRNYGLLGGAICPKCNRPFAIHVYGMNLVVGKLDRCPYCGRWSLVRRGSLAELRAAEAAELDQAQAATQQFPLSEEEKLRKELDESRFQDI